MFFIYFCDPDPDPDLDLDLDPDLALDPDPEIFPVRVNNLILIRMLLGGLVIAEVFYVFV
jgi:hypothetical protein